MKYYFSKSKTAFYVGSLKQIYEESNSWPADAVEISEETYKKYLGMPPEGKILSGTSKGSPTWAEKPKATRGELIEKAEENISQAMQEALYAIKPLEYIKEVDQLSEDEFNRYNKLKKYIVDLSRIKSQEGYPEKFEWPELVKT